MWGNMIEGKENVRSLSFCQVQLSYQCLHGMHGQKIRVLSCSEGGVFPLKSKGHRGTVVPSDLTQLKLELDTTSILSP